MGKKLFIIVLVQTEEFCFVFSSFVRNIRILIVEILKKQRKKIHLKLQSHKAQDSYWFVL